jgi:pyruvate formate lyase activating enzyme
MCPVSRADRWNSGALGFAGSEMDVQKMFRLLEPQLDMLRDIGGLTLSGGEPLLQTDPLLELLNLCAAANIHTTLETSLSLPRKHFEPLIGRVDLWLIGLRPSDSKNADKKKDRLGDWETILKNLEFLAARGANNIIVRTPIIPGYTDRMECLEKIGDVMTANNIPAIELLPYNPYATHYYEAAGLPYPLKKTKPVDESESNRICDYFSERGFASRVVK